MKRALVLITLALATSGCGDDEGPNGPAAPEPGTFVGTLDGTDTAIGLVTDGSRVAGYVCADRGLSIWLVRARISDSKATLTDRRGKRRGTVTFDGDQARGELTADGPKLAFSVEAAGGDAGVFRGLPAGGGATAELGSVVTPARGRAARPVQVTAADLSAALQVAIGWVVEKDGRVTGTVVRFERELPRAAVDDPFTDRVRYPPVRRILGERDIVRDAVADPAGEPDVQLLGGVRYRIEELGPDDL